MGNIISCSNLSKQYGSKKVINNINISIDAGKIIGLLGPNGAGKTTLIKILCGNNLIYDGTIILEDSINSKNDENYLEILRSKIAYCPDNNCYEDNKTVKDLIKYYSLFFDDFDAKLAEELLKEQRIEFTNKIAEQSKGTIEKIKVILTISRRTRLYILDEPFDGVDLTARDDIAKTIVSNLPEDASVIICSHNIGDIEKYLDEVIFIENGNIIKTGVVDELRDEYGKSLSDIFKDMFAGKAGDNE